jgi:hypothetical protein
MIRNPYLNGVKSFFNVYDFAGCESSIFLTAVFHKNILNSYYIDIGCQVDSTHKDSILDDIFGIDPENPSERWCTFEI